MSMSYSNHASETDTVGEHDKGLREQSQDEDERREQKRLDEEMKEDMLKILKLAGLCEPDEQDLDSWERRRVSKQHGGLPMSNKEGQPRSTTRRTRLLPLLRNTFKPRMSNTDSDDTQSGIIEPTDTDSPPPSGAMRVARSLRHVTIFTLMPIFNVHPRISSAITRFLRPRLQKNYSRVEWICSCGDLLYGDYIEATAGSLQSLAAQLGGQVIEGPALRQNASNMSNASSQLPPQAHIVRSPTASTSTGTTSQSSDTDQRHRPPRQAPNADQPNSAVPNQATTTSKWLELCIRSGPDTFVLGEIDIAGLQTDQSVFQSIKRKYESSRTLARLFGRFAYRIPTGGVSVEFRKDKLATTSGSSATASIMKRSCMPGKDDAKNYNYMFDPIPMDEPPIDSRTFNHYFHKPHLADSSQTWIRRFPQLHGVSLFYGQEKLAKSWGFEITEERNWALLVFANLTRLLASGALAGISAYLMQDKPTSVAIGAWLTAVQMLVIAAAFWRWTN